MHYQFDMFMVINTDILARSTFWNGLLAGCTRNENPCN